MKKLLITILTCLVGQFTIAQNFICDNCNEIIQIDKLIYSIDTGRDYDLKGVNAEKKQITSITKEITCIIKELLLPLFHFDNPELFKIELDMINHIETITWLEFVYQQEIDDIEKSIANNAIYSSYSPTLMMDRLKKINERMDYLFSKDISLYKFTDRSDKAIKFLYVEHANDFLSVPMYNDDRDMTGSFRFEVGTDLFKMRLNSSPKERVWNMNSRNWYSYQTLFIGGEGYTPYLRDTTIFNSPATFDPLDRPYASFIYFGRSKHRLYRNGKIRTFSQTKIGTIGSDKAGGVQSLIHRDITIGSLTPNGWESQIAYGGRTAISYEFLYEYLILTNGWLFSYGPSQNRLSNFPKWVNLSTIKELKVGHDMTSLSFGANLSTTDFKNSGGYYLPFTKEKRMFQNTEIILNYRFLTRYVIHNSMLEGYGIFKHAPDEDVTTPVDNHFLKGSEIERWLFIHELNLNIRLKYVGIIIKQSFMSPEYDIGVNSKRYSLGQGNFDGNHNTSKWNHVGTIGLFYKF